MVVDNIQGVRALENVFSYFFAIGAGLTFGIAIVLLPGIWIYNNLRKRVDRNVSKIKY